MRRHTVSDRVRGLGLDVDKCISKVNETQEETLFAFRQ